MKTYNSLRHIGLQFFADPADPNPADPADPADPKDPPADPPKTFTQEDVTRMMATEKKQGKATVLAELGIDPKDKDAVKRVKDLIEASKTAEERQADAVKAAQADKTAAVTRAEVAERKVSVLTSGCVAEYVDEVTTLAAAKVTDTVDFDTALADVKKKFPAFFGESSDPGTGRHQGHRKPGDDKAGSLGSKLAQSRATPSKNPYFNS